MWIACSLCLLFTWKALIPSFEKTEFQESRNSIIHFDVERQTKSQLKKNKKQSVEMIKWISFSKSQEYSSWNDNGACRITSNKQYKNAFILIKYVCTFNINKMSFTIYTNFMHNKKDIDQKKLVVTENYQWG